MKRFLMYSAIFAFIFTLFVLSTLYFAHIRIIENSVLSISDSLIKRGTNVDFENSTYNFSFPFKMNYRIKNISFVRVENGIKHLVKSSGDIFVTSNIFAQNIAIKFPKSLISHSSFIEKIEGINSSINVLYEIDNQSECLINYSLNILDFFKIFQRRVNIVDLFKKVTNSTLSIPILKYSILSDNPSNRFVEVHFKDIRFLLKQKDNDSDWYNLQLKFLPFIYNISNSSLKISDEEYLFFYDVYKSLQQIQQAVVDFNGYMHFFNKKVNDKDTGFKTFNIKSSIGSKLFDSNLNLYLYFSEDFSSPIDIFADLKISKYSKFFEFYSSLMKIMIEYQNKKLKQDPFAKGDWVFAKIDQDFIRNLNQLAISSGNSYNNDVYHVIFGRKNGTDEYYFGKTPLTELSIKFTEMLYLSSKRK